VRTSRSPAQRGSDAVAQPHAPVLRSVPQVGHSPLQSSRHSANAGTAKSHSSRRAGRRSSSRAPGGIGTTSLSSASSSPASANNVQVELGETSPAFRMDRPCQRAGEIKPTVTSAGEPAYNVRSFCERARVVGFPHWIHGFDRPVDVLRARFQTPDVKAQHSLQK
jgi:hypothetical protein